MYFIVERINRILKELKDYIYQKPQNITNYRMKKGYFAGGEGIDLDTAGWEDYDTTMRWGGYEEKDRHYWFRTEVVIPDVFRDEEVVYHMTSGEDGDWDLANPQFLAYVGGQLIQGLDIRHREFTITHKAVPGTVYQIALQAYCGIRGGKVDLQSNITTFDREVEALYYHIKVPMDVIEYLDSEDIRRIDILKYMENTVYLIDLRKPYSKEFRESIKEAYQYLETELYQKYCGGEAVTALCVGHTHIDVAWLWTVKQTREKVARSFSTVLNLMEEYPEYIFMSSQPQLYQYIKEDYPEVYEKIKAKVQEGRWEPEGAMWLEADCNLISGESMIRQILHGKRFFKEEFGMNNEILWLPDVFGYSAALPQILKKSGIKYFMTTKLGWNEYNSIPYDTFMWKGIDGSEVLSHMITTQDPKFNITPHATSYNGHIIPSNVIGAWKRYHQKEISKEVLIAYGYGDGGGGPTREMLENAKRLKHGIPGCPKVELGKSIDFFKRLEAQGKDNKRLPKWTGELYLEYHRGTYTSMARNKRDNRKSEILYQNAELFSVLADAVTASHDYPKASINRGWKTILLNQFHDILPGSAIKEVYEDTQQDYQRVLAEGQRFLSAAIEKTAEAIELKADAIIVFNALSTERSDLARIILPAGYTDFQIKDDQGKEVL
ncbi:MAG: alpha-mannosidase, partial [Herbinix sp.]|nr:alpha-mannosidase [Herbinix sp.]